MSLRVVKDTSQT